MKGFVVSVVCAVAIGTMGAFLIVSWFAQLKLPA